MKNSIFLKNPNVLSRASKSEIQFVRLDESHEVLRLVGLARFIWIEIDGKRTVSDIVDRVAIQQQVKAEFKKRFEADTLRFFKEMQDLKMVNQCER